MDYKKELLLYLYNNNSKSMEFHQIFSDGILSQGEIRTLVKDLKTDGLIEPDEKFRMIGSGSKDDPYTLKNLHIKARIKPLGEQYVRDTYMQNIDNPKINIIKSLFIDGNISGNISLTNDQSRKIEKTTIVKTPKKIATNTFFDNKYIINIFSGIIVAIFGYYMLKWFGVY